MLGLLEQSIAHSCTVEVGDDGYQYRQCKIPDNWNAYNDTCNDTSFVFATRDAITKTQNDFKNNDHRWTTVMWFSDSVWAGTLLTYQQILQHAFTYAVIDLHDKWKDSPNITNAYADLAVSEVYINVTFFLGFCLLSSDNCKAFKVGHLLLFFSLVTIL